MHNRTLIKNAILVNEGGSQLGSIVIEDDRIEEILATSLRYFPPTPPSTQKDVTSSPV